MTSSHKRTLAEIECEPENTYRENHVWRLCRSYFAGWARKKPSRLGLWHEDMTIGFTSNPGIFVEHRFTLSIGDDDCSLNRSLVCGPLFVEYLSDSEITAALDHERGHIEMVAGVESGLSKLIHCHNACMDTKKRDKFAEQIILTMPRLTATSHAHELKADSYINDTKAGIGLFEKLATMQNVVSDGAICPDGFGLRMPAIDVSLRAHPPFDVRIAALRARAAAPQ